MDWSLKLNKYIENCWTRNTAQWLEFSSGELVVFWLVVSWSRHMISCEKMYVFYWYFINTIRHFKFPWNLSSPWVFSQFLRLVTSTNEKIIQWRNMQLLRGIHFTCSHTICTRLSWSVTSADFNMSRLLQIWARLFKEICSLSWR
jgi:hypothetical protein